MVGNKIALKQELPEMFKSLLWSFKWEEIDVDEDRDDIIVGAVNEGTLEHWRWIIKTYGKDAVREVLERHLISEFHPESLNLARVVFSLRTLRHAR